MQHCAVPLLENRSFDDARVFHPVARGGVAGGGAGLLVCPFAGGCLYLFIGVPAAGALMGKRHRKPPRERTMDEAITAW